MSFRTALRVVAATCALAGLLGGFSARAAEAEKAEAAKAEKAPEQTCKGVDMLAETKAKDPDLYRRIMAEADATENSNAILWKIERDGRPASYLFGTVHLTDERVTKLSPAVESALDESKTVALEVSDLSDKATTSVIAKSTPLVMFTDGQRLDKLLSSTEYETVKSIITRSGMPADLAALFKPWIVTMIMSVSDCERDKVQKGARVLDMEIAEIGAKRGLKVVGLETIPEQLKALASVPQSEQLKMLRASLKFANRTDDMMETLVQLYKHRKISAAMPFQIAMAREVGIGDDAFAGFQQKLLVERNARMEKAAEPLLEEGGVFIAIGALHLPGKKGLVALLRQAGYTVTAIE
jgi:uncharacterized protein YbaP (TraB family)